MTIQTNAPDERKIKTAKLREEHEKLLNALGVPDALFLPKTFYQPTGKTEKFIGVFPSELKRGVDIYTEMVTHDVDSEDPTRTLYKWPYNPHWESEYEKATSKTSSAIRHLIPVAELVLVSRGTLGDEPLPKVKFDDIMNPEQDAPLDQLTVRDIAAILLKKPVSTKKWLNDLISK